MKLKLIGFGLIVFVMSLVIIFGGTEDNCEPARLTIEPNESTFELVPYSTESTYDDIVFTYDQNGVSEEVTLNVIDGEIVCNQSPTKAIEIIYKTLCQTYNIREVEKWPVTFIEPTPEPNEPEFIAFSEFVSTAELLCITQLIPTWPEYIELDKDFILITPDKSEPNSHYTVQCEIYIPKGTRIYFKEEE